MPKYLAYKYSGGVYCGNACCDTLDECLFFANDGFYDYVRVVEIETGMVVKMHFKL